MHADADADADAVTHWNEEVALGVPGRPAGLLLCSTRISDPCICSCSELASHQCRMHQIKKKKKNEQGSIAAEEGCYISWIIVGCSNSDPADYSRAINLMQRLLRLCFYIPLRMPARPPLCMQLAPFIAIGLPADQRCCFNLIFLGFWIDRATTSFGIEPQPLLQFTSYS
jgi:hypothetical protein